MLSSIIIYTNIIYSKFYNQKVDIESQFNQEQEIINNRNYVITALYAIEGILDSTISSQLIKINKQLPTVLVNDDLLISTEMLWRYEQLQKLLLDYTSKNDYYNYSYKLTLKQKILLEITALKSDLENIINQNEMNREVLINNIKEINYQLERLFIITLVLLSLIIFSLSYFLRTIKSDNKFKLLDLSKQDSGSDQPVYKNAIIAIEHSCQRINYNNSILIKQLQQQKELITTVQRDYFKFKELIDKLNLINKNKAASINDKASFKIYANIVDMNGLMEKNLNILIQENGALSIQLYKNIKTINNIFKNSQMLSLINTRDIKENSFQDETIIM